MRRAVRPSSQADRRRRRCLVAAGLGALALLAGAGRAAPAATPVERGRYLVESILACGNCHTPKGPDGTPIAGRNLSGGGLTFSIPPYSGTASNITPDRETGLGTWSDADIKRAIVDGKRPGHGRLPNSELAVVMATPFFRALTPADLDAVVAYLRSLPAVRNEIAAPVYRAPQTHQRFPGAEAGFADAKMGNRVYRGRYLATIAHCMECHSPQEKGRFDFGRMGAGGRVFAPSIVQGFPADWSGARAANITSHPKAGLGAWSDAEIRRAITQGISRDGRRLQPPMPFAWYARLERADLDALVAYLRTVPPQP